MGYVLADDGSIFIQIFVVSEDPKLPNSCTVITPYPITFELTQLIRLQISNVTDRRTAYDSDTALCTACVAR